MKIKAPLILLVLSAALGTMTTAAHAQTSASWTGGATGDWNTSNNWSGSTVPNGNFDTWFTNGVATLVDVSSAVSLRSVRSTNLTAATLSGAMLTFDQGGANNITSYLSNSLTISNGITFSGSTTTLNANSGGTTTLNGAITSSGARVLRQLSTGTLFLNGDNSSMTGTNTVSTWTNVTVNFENGTIVVGHDNALGTGRLLFNGGAGTNINLTATNRTIANGLVFGGTGAARLRTGRGSTVTFTSSDIVGTNGITITNTGGTNGVATIRFTGTSIDFTNAINIATSNDRLELSNASGTQSWSGTISGPGGLIKSGAGTVVLGGTNTYTGNTAVSAGELRVRTNAALTFVIGGNGTNNFVSGTGAFLVDGSFIMNLAGAATNGGSSWTVVSGVSATYGTNFLVSGFNGAGGLWTNTTNGVDYVFSQATGVLSVGAVPVNNYTNWVTYWQGIYAGFTNTAGTGDPDGDQFNNSIEFAFDGNPMVGSPALLTAVKSGTNAVFNYVARKNPPGGVTYQVRSTTNLAAGGWTNASVTVSNSANQTGLNIPADYERKEFTVPATSNLFFRVESVIAP